MSMQRPTSQLRNYVQTLRLGWIQHDRHAPDAGQQASQDLAGGRLGDLADELDVAS